MELLALTNDPIFRYFFYGSSVVSLICWIAALKTDNYSQVDRLWSILPAVYAWLFVLTAFYFNTNTSLLRLAIMSVLVTIWGARLTYNFYRKGGYESKNEDYRWIYVRKMFDYPNKKILFHLLSFFFTAFFQNYLLMAIVLPMWYIQTNRAQTNLNLYDLVNAALFLFFLAIEVIADQQQWKYQSAKYKWLDNQKKRNMNASLSKQAIEDFERGFFIRGLFKYSRHPNFWAEMSLWWIIYSFSLSAQYTSIQTLPSLINYSIFGTLSLTVLFQFSTNLTESITEKKYPEYKKYKVKVSRFLPLPFSYNPEKKN